MLIRPFHLAFSVDNLDKAASFYIDVLGCKAGRSDKNWMDFNLYGHQIVAHLDKKKVKQRITRVDNKSVPKHHFGVILRWSDWETLVRKIKKEKIPFLIEPYIRFKEQPGEQATFFICDPSYNALEFKTFKQDSQIFAIQ